MNQEDTNDLLDKNPSPEALINSGFRTDIKQTEVEKKLCDGLEKALNALGEIADRNHLRGDSDVYLYELALWGLGDKAERPKPVEFGLDKTV